MSQYFVLENDIDKKTKFYRYLYSLGCKRVNYTKKEMINTPFPWVINIEKKGKSMYICESITVCACIAQSKKLINIQEFKKIMKEGM